MIRIYLDWNVISSLKRPEYKQLDDFIIEHKEQLLFPYSPAHFNDLMKSYSPDNLQFASDLAKLQQLTGKHFLSLKDNYVVPLFGTPEKYLESEIESLQNKDNNPFDFEKNVSDLDSSKVLYNEFKLPVKILTPEQLIDELSSVMHVESDKTYFVENVLQLYKKDKIVESFPPLEDGAPFVDVIKLDRYFFDFFNYATCAYYTEEDILIVTFKKVFKNYSKFVFYTEVEKVVDKICDYFADMNDVDVLQRRKFTEDDEKPEITWESEGVIIKLIKDEDIQRPMLVVAIKFDNPEPEAQA